MNTPKISVIVPVYKVEQYLHRCVDSILAQTFTDFELLLINDGSPDNCGTICDEYAAKDARVRVFHKENGGVSSARNLGLDNAKGEWVAFVDSDDWVEDGWLASFASNTTHDLVIQSFFATNWKGATKECKVECPTISGNRSNIVLFFATLHKSMNIGYLWCRLFKRKIIETHRIRFNKDFSIKEDEEFIFNYIQHIDKFKMLENAYYHYNCPDFTKKYKYTDQLSKLECLRNIAIYQTKILAKQDSILLNSSINQYGNILVKYYIKSKSDRKKLQHHIITYKHLYKGLNNRVGLNYKNKLFYCLSWLLLQPYSSTDSSK